MQIRFIILFLLISNLVQAQCPSLSFSADSLLCSGDTLNITNTSTGGQSYIWDFCPGDFENGTDTSFLGNYSSFLANCYDNVVVIENGLYYSFCLNTIGTLVRFDYGTSLQNTPTVTSLGNFGILTNTGGMSFIQSDGAWFAYLVSSTGKLFKLNFGAAINSIPAASEVILSGASFANPQYIKAVKEGANYFAVTANNSTNSISVVNLGTDLLIDSATVSNVPLNNSSPGGIDLIRDCNQWVAFVSFLGTQNIERVDFGNSLNNTPTNTTISVTGLAGGHRGIQVIFEGNSWWMIIVNTNGNKIAKIKIGFNILNTTLNAQTLTLTPNAYFSFDFFKVNSKWQSLIVNFTTKDVFLAELVDSCSANTAIDTNFTPSNITFLSNGSFNYSLESLDSLGNFSYLYDSVTVNSAPISDFSNTGSCLNSNVDFNDLSTIGNGTLTNWLWNFGDGTGDTIQNPSHVYTIIGNYPVQLTVTADNGCFSRYTDTISINNRPVSNFTFTDNQCLSKQVFFIDSTTTTSGTTSFWFWNFGDSTTSIDQNPIHSYQSPGTYTVSLSSAVSAGCNDSISKQITILPAPEPDFTILNTCVNDTSFFINNSTIQSGVLTNYWWNFGDGDTSVTVDPLHNYSPIVNTYNVELIAYASNGCTDTIQRVIKINNKPTPGFVLSDTLVCIDELVTFTDTSWVIGDTIANRLWDFGDSNTDNTSVTSHSYSTAGIFTITLTAFSPSSCDSTITKTITVIDKPNVSFTYNTTCEGDSIFFTNSTIPASGSVITSTNWNFGDSNLDTTYSPSHLYSTFGFYNVSLFVTDDKGCFDSDTQQVNIFDVPNADFNLSATCSNVNIQFTDATILTGDTIQQWLWDFGDSGTSILKNPVYSYSTPGTYTIELIVISTQGCSDTVSKTFNFNQTPLATFNFAQTCDGRPVPFTYLPIVFPSPVTNWLWNFGDGGTSAIVNPAHIYANPGSYNVTLTVSDTTNNCSSSVSKTVSVDPIPEVNFGWSGNCEGQNIVFNDSSTISSGALIDWNWTFGDGSLSSGELTNHSYDSAGIYNVTLIAQSLRGCLDSISQTIQINEVPHSQFTFSPSFGSAPLVVNFTNNTLGTNAYTWNFGDTSSNSNDINPNHLYQNSGIYPISLVVENAFGCYDTLIQTINIFNPRNDISVQNVITEINNDLLTVKATLLNVGNVSINSVQLVAQAESYGLISEDWVGNLEPNSPQELYTFSAQFKIDPFNVPQFVCVEAIEPNELPDFDIENNKTCQVLDNEIQFIDPFPNPFFDELILGVNLSLTDFLQIKIYSMNGAFVKELYNAATSKGLQFLSLNTTNISNGYYLVEVDYLNKQYYFSVIKK